MIGGLLKLGFTAFGAAGIVTKLVVVAGALVTITATIGTIYYHIWSNGYEKGRAAAIQEIAEADERALSAARAARNRVLSCKPSDGMRWDTTTGECKRR